MTSSIRAWGISEYREALDSQQLRCTDAAKDFLADVDRLDRGGPKLHTIIETNPELEAEAEAIDRSGAAPGPARALRGIPVLLKDNIDTADAMNTTAGSLALLVNRPGADAPLVSRLRDAGALLVGKANLSEWSNFRSSRSTSGWSARGGLTKNPHALDRSASGSSSGSAAAVAAGIVPVAVGTETDGSILGPASHCGVVGIKPTVGLVPSAGIVPISHGQDTAGPLARSVHDAALLLGVLSGDPQRYLDAATIEASGEIRIGIPDVGLWGAHPRVIALFEDTLAALAQLGARLVRDVPLPGLSEITTQPHESVRLLHDLKTDLGSYLRTRTGDGPRDLAELIRFNREHADEELSLFGQDLFESAELTEGPDTEVYRQAVADAVRCGGPSGIDHACAASGVDVIVAPSWEPAYKIDTVNGDGPSRARRASLVRMAAVAGYPGISVPMGLIGGLPVGICMVGPAYSEPVLIRAGRLVERVAGGPFLPRFSVPRSG